MRMYKLKENYRLLRKLEEKTQTATPKQAARLAVKIVRLKIKISKQAGQVLDEC